MNLFTQPFNSDTDLLLEVEDCLSQPLNIRIQLVGFPDQGDAFSNKSLNLFLKPSHQQGDGDPLLHLLTSALIGAHALNQRDGKWVQLVSLVGFVDDGQRNTEAQPLEVADLFGQGDDLGEEVDFELEHVACAPTSTGALNCEDAAGHTKVALLHLMYKRGETCI